MEQSALLHGQQEDEPVDESQELLKVRRLRQRAVLQRGAERAIVGMREKPLAECDQRILDALPQVLARARPLLAAGGAPDVERAFGGRLAGFAESRFVREQPERGEVRVPSFGEDALEVRLDPRGPREARVVADDAQGEAVGDETPRRVGGCVEEFLSNTKRASAPSTIAERRRDGVDAAAGGRDDDGDAPTERGEADRIRPVRDHDRRRRRKRVEAEAVAQKRQDKPLREGARRSAGRSPCVELAPVRLCDAPVAADLVAEVEPLGNPVVGFALRTSRELTHA